MNDVSAAAGSARVRDAFDLLRAKRYREAWPLYEARRQPPHVLQPMTNAPEWQGEPLDGKRIAVVGEQGWGDMLMFGRFLPLLEQQGAIVICVTDSRYLSRLFDSRGFIGAHLFLDKPLKPCDYWTYFGSLPYRLGCVGHVHLSGGNWACLAV